SVRAIGVTKMLTFVFDPLKETSREQDGVKVSITQVKKELDHWKVEVRIENPPGGPAFGTYESWLQYNAIYLERDQGNEKKHFHPYPAEPDVLSRDSRKAQLSYRFATPGRKPPEKGDWRLVYRTPARVVEITAPFEFNNVPLP